ncbi:hypothetical protein [Embleya hyalina]|uniref:Uncharacterized protein n=1 Tax=Embleya hyalina TaxID=516124 RepID=A0A401Z401_9ACTN|nr:hypothetical protein [Embleya hyalina]GCE01568.1 hypothetical protein EHYA_09334 [Embleya hyalina]
MNETTTTDVDIRTPIETPTLTWTRIDTATGAEKGVYATPDEALVAAMGTHTRVQLRLDVTGAVYLVEALDRMTGNTEPIGEEIAPTALALCGSGVEYSGPEVLPTPVDAMSVTELRMVVLQLRGEVDAYQQWASDQITEGCTPGCYGARTSDTCGECHRRWT